MACFNCGRGFHEECLTKCKKCHPVAISSAGKILTGQGRGAPLKSPEDMKDLESTGRKRAAMMWPLSRGAFCEWQGKKNCGGGKQTIVGCIDGKQVNIHHGPIKNTTRNNRENVHKICSPCHNRWHALNDEIYDEEIYETLPHQPEVATPDELVDNEIYWKKVGK